MPWTKSPPQLVAAFEKARPNDPSVQGRPMFGYPALFVNGNMIAGTFQEKVVVRFGADRTLAGSKTAKTFEPMPGRPMTGFVVVPDAVVKSPAQLRSWIAHALAYTKSMPPKAKKPARPTGRAASARTSARTPAPRARASRKR